MTAGLPYSLPHLLKALLDQNGSDLHISVNSPPRLRIHGNLVPLDLAPLTGTQSSELCYSVLTEGQKKQFESTHELDLSFSVRGLCRFRANIYMQKGQVGGAFRVIPNAIPSFRQLKVPTVVEQLCHLPNGLVLITGATGSGKSTTLAAMIDAINSSYQKHIVTIEDPIEFVHQHKNSLINQRELGSDTQTFSGALRACLRQDPDVILVGELRDLETISMALTAAETGHLVFATMHTNSCVSTINRIIDIFPSEQQAQIRAQLSFSLMGVVCQVLARTVQGARTLVCEVLVPNMAIRNMIREEKVHQIYSQMQIGQENSHMVTMNQSLYNLVQSRQITQETALKLSTDPAELNDMLHKSSDDPMKNARNNLRQKPR